MYCSYEGVGQAAVSTVDVCTHLLQADVIVIVHLVNDDNLFTTKKNMICNQFLQSFGLYRHDVSDY